MQVEPQEVEALRTSGEVHDPGLVRVQLKSQRSQDLARQALGIFGLPLAAGKLSSTPLLRVPSAGWIGLARGVPLLIVIYWLYYAAADRGIFSLAAFLAGVLSLGLTGSGFMGTPVEPSTMNTNPEPGTRNAEPANPAPIQCLLDA